MALFFADLVREFSSSTGAGDFVLGGAVPGHRRFGDVVPAGARFHYAIAGVTRPEQWETGEGEIGSGGTMIRIPAASSAGGALVDFAPGTKTVALTVGASWFAAREAPVAVGDVTGLEAALAGKAAAGHGHAPAEVTGLEAALAGKAAAGHGHALGDVAGLAEAIAGRQPLDAELSALAGLASAADTLPFFTGSGAAALAAFGAFARSLVGAADAAAARSVLGLDAPAPFLRASMQHPTLGLGTAQLVPGDAFTTLQLAADEDNAGGFSGATHLYTVPAAGVYDCHLKVKAVDGASPGGSYGVGIGTANVDSASFAWGQLNASRNGIQNRVVRSFAAGAAIRAFVYADTSLPVNGAELIVRRVG
jgi:hypothetical protein